MTPEEFEGAFQGIDLPDEIELYTGVKIVDMPTFLETSISYLKAHPPSKMTAVIEDRLNRLLELIEKGELNKP